MRQKRSESARELYERDQQSVNQPYPIPHCTDPPSTPVISRTDGLAYPYLAGDRVQMTCDTQPSRGNPAAYLTWSGHGGGQTETPSGAPATLLFPSVSRGDNRRNVTCRASNTFTLVKGQTREVSWMLNVFCEWTHLALWLSII